MLTHPAGCRCHHHNGSGGGRYDVVCGRKLNDAPLTKAEAEAMAEVD
jgi:hypothetical protein